MNILYKDKNIEKQCKDYKIAIKKYNKLVAEKLHGVINFIEDADNLMDVKSIPNYRLHPLKGDKKGEYAIDLGKKLGFRLIIVPLDPKGERWDTTDETTIYNSTSIIIAMEVTNHYE